MAKVLAINVLMYIVAYQYDLDGRQNIGVSVSLERAKEIAQTDANSHRSMFKDGNSELHWEDVTPLANPDNDVCYANVNSSFAYVIEEWELRGNETEVSQR